MLSSVGRAVRWFGRAGLLVDGGRNGVMEGLGTEILPDGRQQLRTIVRNDCTGETALAFFLHGMLTGRRESARIAQRLIDWCFDQMQVKEPGPLEGMMRWTPAAWQVCYADDNARVIIPQLMMSLYGGGGSHREDCVQALRFLVRTTGTDGLRVMRTEGELLDEEAVRELSSKPGALPSAHYNAYYLGALLLAHKLTGIEEFRRVGELGLLSIMAVYPNTRRELSETEELCRLDPASGPAVLGHAEAGASRLAVPGHRGSPALPPPERRLPGMGHGACGGPQSQRGGRGVSSREQRGSGGGSAVLRELAPHGIHASLSRHR